MVFDNAYRRQVGLLVRVLPLVGAESCFALKGGTAINLFVRDLPRLSVDIDLTYLPVEPREQSLKAIDGALNRISERIRNAVAGAQIVANSGEGSTTRLTVRVGNLQTKIEVTPVLRGCVFTPELRRVMPKVEDSFGFAEIAVVSFADLYAGKIVAALDRQHPRDLFDIRDLLANEGIGDALRQAFIVYLMSHDRPMYEVLAPTRKDLSAEYLRGFEGMTEQPVTKDALIETRETLIADIVGRMPADHRRFLVSFERGTPDWTLLGIPSAQELPAVRWRQQNLDKLSAQKRSTLVSQLEAVLTVV